MIELLLEAERALSFGRVDRAEQLYRQVADADPHNSIAVVGLARVALERGDDLAAYLEARRALAIDPENDAARRLVTRLEEVLATRGEPVADPVPRATPASSAATPAAPTPEAPAAPVPDDPAAPAAEAPEPSRAMSEPAKRGRRSPLDRLLRRRR